MLGFFKTGFCRVAALILPKRLGFRVALTQKCWWNPMAFINIFYVWEILGFLNSFSATKWLIFIKENLLMTSTDFQHQNEAICCHSMVSTNLCVSKSKSCSFQLILLMEANDLHKQTRSLHEAAFCCQLFLQHLKFQCLQEHLNYKSRLYRKCFFGCC